ncbi:hypothetical protein TNCV_1275611 [Trichonephila clavipes]|nr:hypothetical protein TNCV_1275611 [Trichonephila clavipes]
MFFWHGRGGLLFLEGKQTAMRYLDILADQVNSEVFYFYPEDEEYFMADNTTVHRARSFQHWFDKHQSEFQQLGS